MSRSLGSVSLVERGATAEVKVFLECSSLSSGLAEELACGHCDIVATALHEAA